jgi:hypothetical protein
MLVGSSATDVYYSANAAVFQTDDQMAKATIVALSIFSTGTTDDRSVVATLT